MREVFQRLLGNEDAVMNDIRQSKYVIKMDAPCFDKDGNPKAATSVPDELGGEPSVFQPVGVVMADENGIPIALKSAWACAPRTRPSLRDRGQKARAGIVCVAD